MDDLGYPEDGDRFITPPAFCVLPRQVSSITYVLGKLDMGTWKLAIDTACKRHDYFL